MEGEGGYVGITIQAQKLKIQKKSQPMNACDEQHTEQQSVFKTSVSEFFFSVFKHFGFQAKLHRSSRCYMYYHIAVRARFSPFVCTRAESFHS